MAVFGKTFAPDLDWNQGDSQQLLKIPADRHLYSQASKYFFFSRFWNNLILWTDLTLLVLEDRQNQFVRNQEQVFLVEPQRLLELRAFGRAASHCFQFLLNCETLLFIAALDILQGCLFTPCSRVERHKYNLWYQTYYLGTDFSSNLNFALIISEEKRQSRSTLWFPFVILQKTWGKVLR